MKLSERDFKFLKIDMNDLCFEIYMSIEEYEVIMAGKFSSFSCLPNSTRQYHIPQYIN